MKIVSQKMKVVQVTTKIGEERIRYLPDAGANILGTVIHNTIDEKYRDPTKDAGQVWADNIKEQNDIIKSQPLNKHLLPLENSNEYLSRKFSTVLFANTKAPITVKILSKPSKKIRLYGSEISVYDGVSKSESQIFGKIDLVEKTKKNGIKITDWKSGNIKDEDGNINTGYETQIKMYAALHYNLQSITGIPIWPNYGALVNPITGEKEEMKLEKSECLSLLKKSQLLHQTIAKVLDRNNSLNYLAKYATPSLDNCGYCPLRPACEPYREWLSDELVNHSNETDPKEFVFDVIGNYRSRSFSSSTEEKGCILIEDMESRVWRISNIDFKASRNHKVLNLMKQGDSIMILNINSNLRCHLSEVDVSCKANPQTQMIYMN